MKTASYVIEPLALPGSVDAPEAGEFPELGELSDNPYSRRAPFHVNVLAEYAGRGIGGALPEPGRTEPGTAGDRGRLNGGDAQ